MAWYNRVAKAVGRLVQRVTGGPPAAPPERPPQPYRQSTYEPPYEPVQPTGPIPSAATPEAAMGLPPEQPTRQPYGFESDLPPSQPPETTWTGYNADEFTIYDPATYYPISTDRYMTADDWYNEALMPADYLRARYDWSDPNIERPNIEILRQLEADGYFEVTERDWEDWRTVYDTMYG